MMRIIFCIVVLLAILTSGVEKVVWSAERSDIAQPFQRELPENVFTALAARYNEQGTEYDACGDYDKALACYDEAIAVDEKNEQAYNAKGVICYKLGKYAEAHTCFTQAISLNPNFAVAYCNRSNNYRAIGAEGAAIADEARWRELTEIAA